MNLPDHARLVAALRASLKETERLRSTMAALAERDHEPIAIVGMDCRFGGGVSTPEELWELLVSGSDVVAPVPADRGWEPSPPGAPIRQAAMLNGVPDFDASFFDIGPTAALAMDPQHRLLLECTWTLLERARIIPETLRGSRTGVFAGIADLCSGYGSLLRDSASCAGHRYPGTTASVAAGRVAGWFGFSGPAVTVDTGCSSSSVAIHLACQALRCDECSMAVAGGVTVMTHPEILAEFSRFPLPGVVAPDGRSKPFSARANGIGFAEGAGVVLLERLSDAKRNGHPVLALVRGSAVVHDGASAGPAAPGIRSQQRAISQALARARLNARDVDAVEAHGTGTVLGDASEAESILSSYGQSRDLPLCLGSVKANIGHTQAASCVAGVIKMVLAMRHGLLPATPHIGEPSPHVDWAAGNVRLLTAPAPWPVTDRPRRSAVCSYGISGTIGHVILEHACTADERPHGPAPNVALPWLVSGRTEQALLAQARRLRSYVMARPDLDPHDIAYSLATTRTSFAHRGVVVARQRQDFLRGLALLTDGGVVSPDPQGPVTALAEQFVRGGSPDWNEVFAGARYVPVDLPAYAFQRERYWPFEAPPYAERAVPDHKREEEQVTSALETNHRRFIDEIWYPENAPDYDVIDEVMDEDFVAHTPHGDIHGRAAFKDLCRMYLTVFPDQTMEVREFTVSENRTIVRWTSEATHDGAEFMGIKPDGKRMSITGLTMAHWDEDRKTMKEVWFAFDLLGIIHQLKSPTAERGSGG